MAKILGQKFFERPTLTVARDLLGKYIVHRARADGNISLMITEVEAYDGPLDLASHASRGRISRNGKEKRAAIMFGEAGKFYMFFTYGMHWMANVVTGPENYPAAILLRGGAYKNVKTSETIEVVGPARLTKFLKIDGSFNGKLATRASGAWFEDRGVKVSRTKITAAKRIGVDYAGPIWSEKKYNFKILKKEL